MMQHRNESNSYGSQPHRTGTMVFVGAMGALLHSLTSLAAGGFPPVVDTSDFSAADGLVISGREQEDFLGTSANVVGDFNGDGYADLGVTAAFADPEGQLFAGEAYIVFGGATVSGHLSVASLTAESGIVFQGTGEGDSVATISGVGDVNGDGFDDVVIGAPSADLFGMNSVGQAYILFGRSEPFETPLTRDSLGSGVGVVLNGWDEFGDAGSCVSEAGDFNNDGLPDVLITGISADAGGRFGAGQAYVVFGASDLPSRAEISLLGLDGESGVVINGGANGDNFGRDCCSMIEETRNETQSGRERVQGAKRPPVV
ncbi:MAG: integrin alpha [Pseudomonadota bacterium]